MKYNNENILDRVYNSKITSEEIEKLFTYLIGKDVYLDYIPYKKRNNNQNEWRQHTRYIYELFFWKTTATN